MPPDIWLKAIAAAVVPVVIISACGLLCLAFYNRLAAVVARLRAFQQETLKEQEAALSRLRGGQTEILTRNLRQQAGEVVRRQMDLLIRRARLLRRTLFGLLGAIACLVLCSLAAGLSVRFPASLHVAGPLFLAGLACMLAAVAFAAWELKMALDPVELGLHFLERLDRAPAASGGADRESDDAP